MDTHSEKENSSELMPPRRAIGKHEIDMVTECLNYYQSIGEDTPYHGKYEKLYCAEFTKYMGGGYTAAVSSGTAAVFVALEALKLPKGAEVILPAVIDAGPLNCIIYQGLVPRLCDTAKRSYNTSLDEIKKRVTDSTKCIIAVHCAGDPLEIDILCKYAKEKGIFVLEDISQAPGGSYLGKKLGTFGEIAACSTMYRKSLTTGSSGGLVYTKDNAIFNNAVAYADRGKPIWDPSYDIRNPGQHLFPALNWNTNELSCAIGVASLNRLDETIVTRKNFCRKVSEGLKKYSKTMRANNCHFEGSSPFYLMIDIDIKKLGCSKQMFCQALGQKGIPNNPNYNFLVREWQWCQQHLVDTDETPNAIEQRDNSFNLFVHEGYGIKEAQKSLQALIELEKQYLI